VTLAAIADDRDFLALDEVEIGITIVIDAHIEVPGWRFPTLWWVDRRSALAAAGSTGGS
jgi:hypothetical protein